MNKEERLFLKKKIEEEAREFERKNGKNAIYSKEFLKKYNERKERLKKRRQEDAILSN